MKVFLMLGAIILAAFVLVAIINGPRPVCAPGEVVIKGLNQYVCVPGHTGLKAPDQ